MARSSACASGIFPGTVAFSRTHFDPIFRATTLTLRRCCEKMKKTEKDKTASTVTQGEQILKKLLLTRFSMRQLVAYIAVYDYRNIQAAAHDLYLDHSTVSKSISEIEAALNMKLFVRHTRGVTPTAAADVFYRHSKQIANQCTRTAAELSRITTGAAMHVVIGCVSYLDTIAIKAVSHFKLQHDNKLVVRLLFGHTGDLHRRLKLDEIDLVICRLGTHAEQPDIHAETVYDVGDIIVVRPDHPCASQPGHHAQEIDPIPLDSSAAQQSVQKLSRVDVPSGRPAAAEQRLRDRVDFRGPRHSARQSQCRLHVAIQEHLQRSSTRLSVAAEPADQTEPAAGRRASPAQPDDGRLRREPHPLAARDPSPSHGAPEVPEVSSQSPAAGKKRGFCRLLAWPRLRS